MQHIIKKHLIVVFLLFFLIITAILSGCSEKIPATTSKEAGLYLLENTVVGLDGKEIVKNGEKLYGLAHNGDIISLADKTIIVAAYNVEELNCVDECEVSNEEKNDNDGFNAEIPVVNISAIEKVCEYSTLRVKLSVKPKNAESRYITINSDDNRIVCFDEDEESTTVEANETGVTEIKLTVKHKGKVKLTVCNAINEKLCSFTIKVTEIPETDKEQATKILDRVNDCKHIFKDEKFALSSDSDKSKGYTEKICTKCGLVEYSTSSDEEACNHIYEIRVIAPTNISRGFKLHTCTLCGDTYKDNFTATLSSSVAVPVNSNTPKPVITQAPESTETPKNTESPVPAPAPEHTPETDTGLEETDT